MKKTLLDTLIEKAEELGWWVRVYDDCIEIGQESPAGEDFFFSINNKEDVAGEVREYAEDFDPDEHAEMWIEGRGTRGTPRSIRTLIDDADAIADMLDKLAEALTDAENEYLEEAEEEEDAE